MVAALRHQFGGIRSANVEHNGCLHGEMAIFVALDDLDRFGWSGLRTRLVRCQFDDQRCQAIKRGAQSRPATILDTVSGSPTAPTLRLSNRRVHELVRGRSSTPGTVGFGNILEGGVAEAETLSPELVYAGFTIDARPEAHPVPAGARSGYSPDRIH